MLAAVDAASGSEADVDTPRKRLDRHVPPTSTDPATAKGLEGNSDDSSQSDSDAVARVPRGRLAARLHAQEFSMDPRSESDANSAEEAYGDAYQRVRKQLLTKKKLSPAETSPAAALQVNNDEILDLDVAQRPEAVPIGTQTPESPLSAAPETPTRNHGSSPGSFITPEHNSTLVPAKEPPVDYESDSELPADRRKNVRFLALVAKKRAERQAKQAAEDEKKAAREARLEEHSVARLGSSEEDSDGGDGGKKLTQQARPTRKASKKALEEMNRETQRMNRNMQLAHQAKTKKRITKESLFARFNFRTTAVTNSDVQQTMSSSTAVSSVPPSDAENAQPQATPPSSPPESTEVPQKYYDAIVAGAPSNVTPEPPLPNGSDDELPSLQDVMSEPQPTLNKGKVKVANEAPIGGQALSKTTKSADNKRPVKVRLPQPQVRSQHKDVDLDSDLEIMPARKRKGSKFDVFDRVPKGKASETRSLQTLRALAHLNSPPGKQSGKQKPSMSLSDMQTSLQQRARQQAAAERAEKIQDLKNKGIIIQTAEERQKDQAEIEDLVEKARREADEIKKMEKDAAKKAKKANGEADELNDSSDDDYQEDAADEAEVELSGSDEEAISAGQASRSEQSEDELAEDEEGEGGVQLDGNRTAGNGFVDDEAMEDAEEDDSVSEEEDGDADEDEEKGSRLLIKNRKPRVSRIVDSDDEDGVLDVAPTHNKISTPESSKPIIPGLAMAGKDALPMMGMTQAFAATMADSQTQAPGIGNFDQEQDSLSFLGPVPQPDFPVFDSNDTESMVIDSQDLINDGGLDTTTDQEISLEFSQSQLQCDMNKESQNWPSATQDDDIPDPTQDVGFGMSSPAANRFVSVPPSTVDTVLLPGAASPIGKKKGRLQRGKKVISAGPGDDGNKVVADHAPVTDEITANAFDVLKRKRNTTASEKPFDKKRSEAKGMVEDQALESEDEYAGLGGASDDESGGSEDEEVRKMIEHGDVDVDERKIAAFYA